MKTELQNKIKSEMRKAFAYFGENNEIVLADKVESEFETLMCFMAGSEPEVIKTDKGEVSGYPVDLATTFDPESNKISVAQMLVTKNDIVYILSSYIANEMDESQTGSETQYGDKTNMLVKLEDILPEKFI